MAVPNVDKITSTLARLPDQALQQYAQMHKNDPYIMSLAVSESNRSKELRAAAQAPQGMQEQPKVADAALAQMAPPQEQGIAALPAPNMQMMADGGIAGYEGYGEGDESYGQEPVMMMAGGGAVERYQDRGLVRPELLSRYQQEAQEMGMGTRMQFSPEVRSVVDQIQAQQQQDYLKREQGQMLRGPSLMGGQKMKTPEEESKAQMYAEQDKLMKGYKPRREGDEFDAEEAMLSTRAAAKPAPEIPKSKGTGAGKGKANIVPPPKQEAAAEKGTPEGGLASLFKAQTPQQLKAEVDAMAKGDIERMDKEYSPFLEELKAEKEAIGKRKDSNVGEALLRAGLGMMGGKSKNAFENISAGAISGLDAYTAAQKADEAARRALRQSEMSIMQAQRAERSGYHKDAVALMANARQQEQFAVSSAQQAEQIKNTKAFQEGSLANQRIMAEAARTRASAAGGGGMSKEAKLKLDNLKAYSANLKEELKNPMMALPRNAALKKSKEAELAQINAALAQAAGLSTMMPASPTGASGGVKFLGYEE